jgi:gamma-butyrobetaine dioxygenase
MSSFPTGSPPRRTADAAEAHEIVAVDGCVVLTGLGTDPAAAVAVAHDVFGADVLRAPEPSEVRIGGDRDRRLPTIDHTTPLLAHTDGFAYGLRYPDHFLLLCAQSSPAGGESFLVDGQAVVEHLLACGQEALVARLATVAVDQTEPDMQRSIDPIIGRTPAGRMMLRLFPFQRPSAESDDPDADAAMIAAWRGAVTEAAAVAPRFKLAPGEAVIVDNYRMMHGREAYADLDRLMWRVWVWTTASLGVPAGPLHSDSRYAVAR